MLGNAYFYRNTIRNYVIAFGSMFNDIDIKKTDANDNVLSVISLFMFTEFFLESINSIIGNLFPFFSSKKIMKTEQYLNYLSIIEKFLEKFPRKNTVSE